MNWLAGNWHFLISQPWSTAALCLLAVVCGGAVGVDRERKDKPAGLRTFSLVCLGSAVFTMMSVSFSDGDPSRVASQILPGIGFLGAGAILRGKAGVRGVTTAATIWVVASMGMVIGLGYGGAGVLLGGLILTILTIIARIEHRYLGHCHYEEMEVVFDSESGQAMTKISAVLNSSEVPLKPLGLEIDQDGKGRFFIRYCHVHQHHREFLVSLAAIPEIKALRHDSASGEKAS